ncbi:MAG: hypothetical protein AAGE80_17305 [Pseudomonadota bacterium]
MKLYFRKRRQGAFAFRLDVENRQRRLDMIHIATITENGEVEPKGGHTLTDTELEQIEDWIAGQSNAQPEAEPERAIRAINHLAQWITEEAGDDDILTFADPVLLAMHDLRQVIVRRLSEVGNGSSNGND